MDAKTTDKLLVAIVCAIGGLITAGVEVQAASRKVSANAPMVGCAEPGASRSKPRSATCRGPWRPTTMRRFVASDHSNQWSTTRPTPPTNLTANAGAAGVALSWGGSSSSSSPVLGYRVYRNSDEVAQTSSTSFTDTGVTDGTAYSYYVVAYSQADKVSRASNIVTVTLAGTTAPTAPSNLTADPGDGQVTLSWSASTDNVGIESYSLYRNDQFVASTTGTSYSDTGLNDGTSYSYYVTAADPAGNASAQSNRVSATPSASCLPWLQASGNQIVVAGTAQQVMLHGVNIMEAEWRNNVDWERIAIPNLASAWHGNIVIHGFASDPVNNNDSSYLALLDQYVALTRANHTYVVFSWRSDTQNGPQLSYPDAGAQSALATLAARYKGDSHVMFSLQVEPHDVTWSFVRPIFEQMIDAIRQAAAPADPLIFVPGVDWGKDISGAIADPVDRTNIVYQSHPYTSAANFSQYFGTAVDAGLPVFIGEFGPTDYMTMDDVQALLDYARLHSIGWAAWGYEYDATPSLIDSSLTPTSSFGTTVQTAMLTTPPIRAC